MGKTQDRREVGKPLRSSIGIPVQSQVGEGGQIGGEYTWRRKTGTFSLGVTPEAVKIKLMGAPVREKAVKKKAKGACGGRKRGSLLNGGRRAGGVGESSGPDIKKTNVDRPVGMERSLQSPAGRGND